MRLSTLLKTAVLAIIMSACESKETQYRAPQKKPSESTEAKLTIRIPGPENFPMSNGNPGDFLNSYLLRITTNSKACEEVQRYELKDYVGADSLEFPVKTTCNFKIRFAIGKEGNSTGLQSEGLAFDAFYTTENSVDIESDDLAAGDFELRLHLKRTTLGEKIGFSNDWVKDDLNSTDDENQNGDDVSSNNTTSTNTTTNTNNSGTSVSYAELKSTIDRSCATCHRPGGSRAASNLSTYVSFKSFGSDAVARITAGTMPPGNPLSADLVKKFKDWQSAGFPEAANSNTSNSANGNASTGDQRVVEFRIKAGTGSGAWNSSSEPVVLKVGQTLRIINDDTIRHRLHTDGAPCPHGNNIQPGQSEDCVISRTFSGSSLYDHNNLGKFYLRAER